MVHFVGAGPGACDLITVRGMNRIREADVIIYAGSLVNPELLSYAKVDCEIYNSAHMTLDEVVAVMREAEAAGKGTVRLHTGDPSVYGAIREQMDLLDECGIAYDVCPGVSAVFGAAASLACEYTLPDVTQTLILTRAEGKTPVPEKENLRSLAAHRIGRGLPYKDAHLAMGIAARPALPAHPPLLYRQHGTRRRIPPLAGQRRRTGNRNFPQIQGHRTAAVRVPCGRITPRNPQTGIIANTSGSAAISPTA